MEPMIPPPREVRQKTGAGCDIGCLRFVILPPVFVCMCLLVYSVARLYVLYRGTPTVATVVAISNGPSRNGSKSLAVQSQYSLHGHRFTTKDTWPEFTPSPRAGDHFSGRAASFVGYGYFIPESETSFGEALSLAATSAGFLGFIGFLFYWAWIWPIRRRWIVMFGEAAAGVVNSWSKRSRKGSYRVTYTFTTPDGMARSGKCWASGYAERRGKGDAITVLYDPNRPQQNLVYEASGFIVSGPLMR